MDNLRQGIYQTTEKMARDKIYKLTAVMPSVRSMIFGNIISRRYKLNGV